MSPNNPILANKVSARALLGFAAMAAVAVSVAVGFYLQSQAHKASACLITGQVAEECPNGPEITELKKPDYLEKILPRVHGLAIEDVDGESGHYKLVAWSSWPSDQASCAPSHSRYGLVKVAKGGNASMVWQSPDEELYAPRIEAPADWSFHGHQVFVILRQAGAAYVSAEPVWVDDNTIKPLPALNAEAIEVKELNGPGHHELICHNRDLPQNIDVPQAYRWDGQHFIDLGAPSQKN